MVPSEIESPRPGKSIVSIKNNYYSFCGQIQDFTASKSVEVWDLKGFI